MTNVLSITDGMRVEDDRTDPEPVGGGVWLGYLRITCPADVLRSLGDPGAIRAIEFAGHEFAGRVVSVGTWETWVIVRFRPDSWMMRVVVFDDEPEAEQTRAKSIRMFGRNPRPEDFAKYFGQAAGTSRGRKRR